MKRATPTNVVTMREFRSAPAKILKRAARTKSRIRVGDFVLAVEEAKSREDDAPIAGCMRDTGRIIGDPSDILSTHDRWDMDE